MKKLIAVLFFLFAAQGIHSIPLAPIAINFSATCTQFFMRLNRQAVYHAAHKGLEMSAQEHKKANGFDENNTIVARGHYHDALQMHKLLYGFYRLSLYSGATAAACVVSLHGVDVSQCFDLNFFLNPPGDSLNYLAFSNVAATAVDKFGLHDQQMAEAGKMAKEFQKIDVNCFNQSTSKRP